MKRVLSLLLVLVMCFGLVFPTSVFASDGTASGDPTVITTSEDAGEVTTDETAAPPSTEGPSDTPAASEPQDGKTSNGDTASPAPDADAPMETPSIDEAAPSDAPVEPSTEPTEQPGDAADGPAITDGTLQVYFVREDADMEYKVTFSEPVSKIAYMNILDPDFTELDLTIENPAATIDGNVVTFSNDWLALLGDGSYTLRFSFASGGNDITLPMVVKPTYDIMPEEDEIGEDGLTDEQRAIIEDLGGRINELPTAEDIFGMNKDEVLEIYNRTQAYYDEWSKQDELVKMLIGTAKFEELFELFNSLVSTMAATEQHNVDLSRFTSPVTMGDDQTMADGTVERWLSGDTSTIHGHSIDGYGIAYCLDFWKPAANWYTTQPSRWWNEKLHGWQRTAIQKILTYGYPNCQYFKGKGHDHNDTACRVATQCLLWSVTASISPGGCAKSNGTFSTSNDFFYRRMGSEKKQYEEILFMVANHLRVPSWLHVDESTAENDKNRFETFDNGSGKYTLTLVDRTPDSSSTHILNSSDVGVSSYLNKAWFANLYEYPKWDGWTFKVGTNEEGKLTLTVEVTPEGLLAKGLEDPEGIIAANTKAPWRPDSDGLSRITLFRPGSDTVESIDYQEMGQVAAAIDPATMYMAFEGFPRFPLAIQKNADVLYSATRNVGSDYADWDLTWQSAPQEGATFIIYAEEDITSQDKSTTFFHAGDQITDLNGENIVLTTDASGHAQSEPLYCGKYRVHEVSLPDGYTRADDVIVEIPFPSEVEEVQDVYTANVTNKPAQAEVTIVKKDGETNRPLDGAVLGLFTAEEIVTKDSTTIPARSCIERLTTDAEGKAVFGKDLTKKLIPANHNYYVQELGAPEGYIYNGDNIFNFNFVSNAENCDTAIIQYESEFSDEIMVGVFSITKEDILTHGVSQGDAKLIGELEAQWPDWVVAGDAGFDGVYGLYAREDIIHMDGKSNNAKNPTEYLNDGRGDGVLFKANELVQEFTLEHRSDGTYGFSIDENDKDTVFYAGGIPLGKYYVKEISPPYGYKLSDTEYDIEVLPPASKTETTKTVEAKATVTDDVIVQVHQFIKVAGENGGQSVVEVPLVGAGFSAWLESDLIAAGYVKEDGHGYIPAADAQGNIQWDKGEVQPVKLGVPGANNTIDPESHTSGDTKSHDAGKFPSDGTVIYSMHDDKGDVQTIPLPFGTYIVREVDTPKDYKPIADFIIRTPTYPNEEVKTLTQNEHDNPAPHFWQAGVNYPINAYLKIIKADNVTGKAVLKTGAKYVIYDEDNELVVQTQHYPQNVDFGTLENPYEVNAEGYLTTIEALEVGTYRVVEVAAPEDYVLPEHDEIPDNDDGITISVTSTNPDIYLDDGFGGESPVFVIPVTMKNAPQVGDFTLTKTGEAPVKYENGVVTYEQKPLDGAKFEVRAKTTIYTPDNQVDENGDRIVNTYNGVRLTEGALVATLTTDAKGVAELKGLPLGTYTVKEVDPSNGYVIDPNEYEFTLTYEGETVSRVTASLELTNKMQDVRLSIFKHDKILDKPIEGAEFTLYAAEDIYDVPYGRDTAGAKKVFSKDEVITVVVSDADGNVVFPDSMDLPLGNYYAVETKSVDGYVPVKDDNIPENDRIDFEMGYAGMDAPTVEQLNVNVENVITQVAVMKVDAVTNNPLNGATFRILDKSGAVVDTWTSEKGTQHITYGLHIGEEYTLVEDLAPYGYLKAQDVKFTVANTVEVQTVEMRDEYPTAHIIIDKDGEVLDSVSFMQTLQGWLTSLFNWITGSLEHITFEVYATEDIKAADGVSPDYYKAGDLVAEITTDASGIAELREVELNGKTIGLPLGKYTIKEKATQDGYVLDGEPRYVELLYVDQYTAIVHYTDSWMNERIRMHLSLHKVDAEDEGISLAGAVFALYSKQDIQNVRGEVVVKAGEHLAERATDASGNIDFDVDVPSGYTYAVKELTPPIEHATNTEEFTYEFLGTEHTAESGTHEFTIKDERLHVNVYKQSTTGEPVIGAMLEVRDAKGVVVDSWTSEAEPHLVEGLTAGESYTLVETKPADGYVTADPVPFTVQDTADPQPIYMKDAPTTVEWSKKSSTTGEELPGAKLSIIDENGDTVESWTSSTEPHIVTKLVVGKTYTLHEDLAPLGYATASDVEFTVQDTADVQKVEMVDEIIKVNVSKKDITDMEELPGARLEIHDSEGNVVESWESTDTPHYVEGLHVGEKYTLHETRPADGYATAEVVEFTIEDTGDIQYVEMLDAPIEVDISKKSATTGEELPGAKLQLFDENDELIDEWTSTDKPHRVEHLVVGKTYRLHEDLAPLGYATASDVEFTIQDTGDVQKVEMLDEITKVTLSKKDATTGEELPGAKLQLFDEEGNLIDEWTSTDKPHYVEGLHVGETYTLHEDLAPLGYATASDVEFTIEDTGDVQEVEMIDEIIKVNLSKKDATNGEELPGAKLQLFDEEGNLIDEWTSTDKPHYVEGLHAGEKYTLHEDLAPLGYATASDVEFTVEDTGDVQEVEMIDEIIKVDISKKDATTGEELPGAKLQLFDKDGNLVDEWTSTDQPHHIEGLHVGEKYTLHEDLAPLGYATASDVEFTIEDTGEVQKVEMLDEIIQVEVSKKDATTGEELPGAKLQVLDKDGNIVDEWESTEEPHIIEGLHVGETYTLHEDLAPLGYATASDVEFTIEDTGEVQKVEMLDEIIKVEVSKQNVAGNELPGAKLQVKDKDGNIVDEWTSTNEPHIIEGLHVGEKYTLHEDLAPLGYAKASDVEFVLEDTAEVQKVKMVDELVPSETPKTDDTHNNLFGLVAAGSLLLMAAFGCGYGIYRRKKEYGEG